MPDALQQPAIMRSPHLGHDDATHPEPLDDAEDPDELELLAETQLPALQMSPTVVQSTHALPPVPQFALSEPAWHVAVPSQHPAKQEVLPHDPLPLLPLAITQAPPWQVVLPEHKLTFCQLPVASQSWASLPLHRVAPGAQPPVHMPLSHAKGHGTAGPQAPVALQVWTPVPTHCVAPGAHGPTPASPLLAPELLPLAEPPFEPAPLPDPELLPLGGLHMQGPNAEPLAAQT